ncbi:MAG TPA: Rieske 2Fe-2S domain-containing protein [Pseudorhodoferax sp.]|nr:Rieske 2Fe-2S domain-containing protein [Pseudorhodoferax sp.]
MKREENELLTRVGKGTPMGELMRRYWHPICTSAELPEPDGDPLRTRLLGETFVVFRDTQGRVGVLDELCMHRGASLALGRVEDGGIRCLYHGWKFAVDGSILETPNHPDPRLRERLKAPCYPVHESAGLVWTYIGPAEHQPPFRRFGFEDVPESNRVVLRINVHANYLQTWEGGTDTSHVTMLHSNAARPSWALGDGKASSGIADDLLVEAFNDTAPKLEIEDTSFGFHYAGIRTAPGETGSLRNVRVVPIFLPNGRIIPFRDFSTWVFETPQDDEHTSTYMVDASPSLALSRAARLRRSGLHEERFYKDNNFVADWGNRLGQDREAMRRRENWTGFSGISQEDAIISTSMGPVYDRTKEHLVAADTAIVRLRRRLLDAVRRFQQGGNPPAVQVEDMTRMRAFDTDWDIARPWQDIAPDHRTYFRAEPEQS